MDTHVVQKVDLTVFRSNLQGPGAWGTKKRGSNRKSGSGRGGICGLAWFGVEDFYMALRSGRRAGLLAAQVSSIFSHVLGEPGVSRPRSRGVAVWLMAVWLAGIWSM